MQAEAEQWRTVEGFPDYEVSDLGRVRSLIWKEPRVMKPNLVGDGYHALSLFLDGKMYRRYFHHLVLFAFVGPRPEGMEACHNDGDRTNNRADNLRWGTHSSNARDTIRHGTRFTNPPRGEGHYRAKLTDQKVRDIRERRVAGETSVALAKEYGVSKETILSIIHRRHWKHIA